MSLYTSCTPRRYGHDWQIREGGPHGRLRCAGRLLRDGSLVIDTEHGDPVAKAEVLALLYGVKPSLGPATPEPEPTPPKPAPAPVAPPQKPKRKPRRSRD